MLVGTCWKRSQFVLTANFRSFSLIGLQIGSPSRFTITAGVLLKKIVGGSALMPSTFFGTIWLLSTLARTRSSAITRSSSGIDLLDRRDDLAHLLLRQGLEVGLDDPQVLEAHEPVGERHAGVGLELDRARAPACCRTLSRYDTALNATMCFWLFQLDDLRLVDEDAAAARQGVHARPAAVDRRRRRRGRASTVAVVCVAGCVVGAGAAGRRRRRLGLRRPACGHGRAPRAASPAPARPSADDDGDGTFCALSCDASA